MESDADDKSEPGSSEINPASPRKHDCADCKVCLLCSDARCHCCRDSKNSKSCSKMSMAEQIELYEKINAEDPFLKKRRK